MSSYGLELAEWWREIDYKLISSYYYKIFICVNEEEDED